MQDKLQGLESTPPVTERRAPARLRVTSLMYIDIGSVNGGIVTSLSENGLALTAADTLRDTESGGGPLSMRIQIPGIPVAIEASGHIVWTSASGKEACVRFEEIGEKAREQIRGWISDQISRNGLRQGPPKLPRMRLPSSRRAKERASRFSFADVASSRVDAVSETGLEGFPETGTAPSESPTLQAGAVAFRDGAEVVASAFENPAFAESQPQEAHSARSVEGIRATPDDQPQRQPSPSIPERRQHSRRPILLFTYAVLGDDNGGLVFNLGEGGMAFTAAADLQEQHFAKIRLRFPDSEDWIDTSGRLAWKNDSGKEAGIEFLNLPEDARDRIREWVSRESSADVAASKESVAQELPHFMDPEEFSSEPFEIPASFEEQPFEDRPLENRFEEQAKTSAPSSSALFKTGIRGILERASIRRRVAKIKPPRFADHSVKPHRRVASKALSIAVGIALAVGGWMFLQRSSLNQASGIIAQSKADAEASQEVVQKPAKTEAGAVGATADPPVQLREDTSENIATQTPITKPSVQPIETEPRSPNTSDTSASIPNSGLERAPEETPRREAVLADKPPAILPSRSSDQTGRPAPSHLARETEPTRTAASALRSSLENKRVENKPSENKPIQIAPTLPSQKKDINATPPSLNPNPTQPTETQPVALAKEKSPEPPKQPEPLVARTPVVSVSFDPFPSIRMPKAEKSKKSHQGKSLQMGRLLSRVDPIYPEEARQQGVEGAARVHAIFNRDGSVQSVISLSGPPLLVNAAIKAVQQWRYSQTILGGQPMETEEDVTVEFRLANPASKN